MLRLFGHTRATRAALLSGERGWHGYNTLAGAFCLARKDGAERCPASIADALAEAAVAPHVGDPQIVEIDHVIRADEHARYLLVDVAPLSPHLLMLLGEELDRPAAALAALLAATHSPLRVIEGFLCLPVLPGVLGHRAICRDKKWL